MRLLLVSWLPLDPVDSGYRRRVTGLVRALADKIEVRVVEPEIISTTASSHDYLRYSFRQAFFQRVAMSAREFRPTHLLAEGLWSARAVRKVAFEIGLPWGVTVQNIEWLSAVGIYPGVVVQVLKLYEKHRYRQADFLFAITHLEQSLLVKELGGKPAIGTTNSSSMCEGTCCINSAPPVFLSPNGTTLPDPVSKQMVEQLRSDWQIQPNEKVVLFMGKLDYPPNKAGLEWFSRTVCPLVIQKGFTIRWIAAGQTGSGHLIPPFKKVGYVENQAAAMSLADVAIAPVFHGSGTSIKILDYLAMGCPVVATPHAIRGLELTSGEHLLLGETEQELAGHLSTLLLSPDMAKKLGSAGRNQVFAHYNWDTISSAMISDLESI